MKKQSPSILRLTLTLLLITAVVAAALAGVNAITAERIAAATREKINAAIATVLPDVENPQPVSLPEATDSRITAVYAAPEGYAVEVRPAGFGGEITMMVGLSPEGTVLGIAIVSHTETAGLGAVAASDSAKGQAFRNQFTGAAGLLAVTKDGGAILPVTGATVTSRAVTDGVNLARSWVVEFGEQEASS